MKRILSSILFFLLLSVGLRAQENIATFGVQYKPIFSFNQISKDIKTITEQKVDFNISQPGGHCFGMVIRRGFKKGISIESGINLTKRKYRIEITDSTFSDESGFSMISYEIPFSLLVYIRTGKLTFMNASFGTAAEMFASEIFSETTVMYQNSLRKSLMDLALLANLGFEYRSKNSGYFYFGVSYHRPFRYIYNTTINYNSIEAKTKLYGTYLTCDLRYFFHEDPIKKKEKKSKKKKVKGPPDVL